MVGREDLKLEAAVLLLDIFSEDDLKGTGLQRSLLRMQMPILTSRTCLHNSNPCCLHELGFTTLARHKVHRKKCTSHISLIMSPQRIVDIVVFSIYSDSSCNLPKPEHPPTHCAFTLCPDSFCALLLSLLPASSSSSNIDRP